MFKTFSNLFNVFNDEHFNVSPFSGVNIETNLDDCLAKFTSSLGDIKTVVKINKDNTLSLEVSVPIDIDVDAVLRVIGSEIQIMKNEGLEFKDFTLNVGDGEVYKIIEFDEDLNGVYLENEDGERFHYVIMCDKDENDDVSDEYYAYDNDDVTDDTHLYNKNDYDAVKGMCKMTNFPYCNNTYFDAECENDTKPHVYDDDEYFGVRPDLVDVEDVNFASVIRSANNCSDGGVSIGDWMDRLRDVFIKKDYIVLDGVEVAIDIKKLLPDNMCDDCKTNFCLNLDIVGDEVNEFIVNATKRFGFKSGRYEICDDSYDAELIFEL